MNNNLKLLIDTLQSQISSNPKNNMKRVINAIEFFNLNFINTKLIHVAGTNGKGSVCKYLTQILTEANYKVGTFVSPYLRVFNERFLLNNKLISDSDLEIYIQKVLNYNNSLEEKMSFFELITLLALLYFNDNNLDVIIMETGIGGKYDVTNVLNYDLSLITNIGTDHLDKLGPTKKDVLFNKLGILKEGGTLFHTIDKEFHSLINDYATNLKAKSSFINEYEKINDIPLKFRLDNNEYVLNMIGDFQMSNASLAISGLKYLFPNLDIITIQKAIKNAKWAGRMDVISTSPYIIIDAAHNKEAAAALANAMTKLYNDKEIVVIMSILEGKDYHSFINEMKKISKDIILSSFDDFRLADLSKIAIELNIKQMEFLEAVKLINDNDKVYLVTGSIHFIGYFLNNTKY